jgi:hypothetical protein
MEYKKEIDILEKIVDADDYYMAITYPLSKILDESIRSKLTPNSKPDAISRVSFLYENLTFVQQHLEFFICRREGSACSVDKSSYIIRAYEMYFLSGTPLGLPFSDDDEKNHCYWKPHFWNDDLWLYLLECLIDLYYGNATRYLVFMKTNFIDEEDKNEK